jgi:hypothetical protein
MCLYATGSFTEPRYTKGERIVWKILFVNSAGFHYTPVTKDRVRPIQLSGDVPLIGLGETELSFRHGTLYVGRGFIHAFTEKPSKDTMRVWNEIARDQSVKKSIGPAYARVVMCIIPEGIRYYEDGKGEIAARMMYIVPETPESKTEKRRKLLQKYLDTF